MPAYTPPTIDTSQIELSSDLEKLTEHLAENNHDHWARKRIEEGWRYGLPETIAEKSTPTLCRTPNSQNPRRTTIAKRSPSSENHHRVRV